MSLTFKVSLDVEIDREALDAIIKIGMAEGIAYWCSKVDAVPYTSDCPYGDSLLRGESMTFHCKCHQKEAVLTLDKITNAIQLLIPNLPSVIIGNDVDGFRIDPKSIDWDLADMILQYALFDCLMFDV